MQYGVFLTTICCVIVIIEAYYFGGKSEFVVLVVFCCSFFFGGGGGEVRGFMEESFSPVPPNDEILTADGEVKYLLNSAISLVGKEAD